MIYIPILEYGKLLLQEMEDNNYMARQLVGSEIDDESLLYLNKVVQEYNKEYESNPFNFHQRATLDDLNTTYEVNGNAVGTNYTLIPFSYGPQKRKVKVMYKDAKQEEYEKEKNNLTLSL